MTAKCKLLRILILFFTLVFAATGLSQPFPTLLPKDQVGLKESDIPIWFDSMDDYGKYDVDVICQAMDIVTEADIPKWKKVIDDLHKQGKLFFAALRPLTHLGNIFEFVMNEPGLQQAACEDFNLNPIQTPWMIGRKYKNIPIYLYCGNNPSYRAFLRHQVYMFMEAGADGIMVDDYTGSPASFSSGGCFCPYCMDRFKAYLHNKYSPEQLAELGITDLDSFDYRKIVLKYADDAQTYRKALAREEIPLSEDFRDFLFQTDAALFKSLKDMASEIRGKYVPMGWDNVDFRGNRAVYYDFLDVYYSEIAYQKFRLDDFTQDMQKFSKSQHKDEYLPPGIIYIYKFSDATHKWFMPTPEPWSWSAFKVKNMSGLLKLWTAFSYANGALMRYPRKGWCFGETSRWYYPKKEEFEPLYQFIRTHHDLFDDYCAIEQIGVLYCHAPVSGGNEYFRPLKYVAGALLNANIPFGLEIAGDKWLSHRIEAEDINRFEMILVPEPYKLDAAQQKIVDEWKARGRAVSVREPENVEKIVKRKIKPLVSLKSQSHIWLFPRKNSQKDNAPLICHVVNWDYDARNNKMNRQRNVKIQLSEKLLNGKVEKVIYYPVVENHGPVELDFTVKNKSVIFTVPNVKLWGIVKVVTG